jgi:hypothetical protein
MSQNAHPDQPETLEATVDRILDHALLAAGCLTPFESHGAIQRKARAEILDAIASRAPVAPAEPLSGEPTKAVTVTRQRLIDALAEALKAQADAAGPSPYFTRLDGRNDVVLDGAFDLAAVVDATLPLLAVEAASAPIAWLVRASNGNVRLWTHGPDGTRAMRSADQWGVTATALYDHPTPAPLTTTKAQTEAPKLTAADVRTWAWWSPSESKEPTSKWYCDNDKFQSSVQALEDHLAQADWKGWRIVAVLRSGKKVVLTRPAPPIPAGETARLVEALRTAISHIEHLAAWIGRDNRGYSFESLGEDMPSLKEALLSAQKANTTQLADGRGA